MNKIVEWMGKTIRLLVAIALCLFALETSYASEPRLEFQGINLGLGEAEFRSKVPHAKCTTNKDVVCVVNNSSVGSVPARAGYTFDSGRLVMIVLHFDKFAIEAVVKALRTKYGRPTQTGADGSFYLIGWARGSDRIEIQKDEDARMSNADALVIFQEGKLRPYPTKR